MKKFGDFSEKNGDDEEEMEEMLPSEPLVEGEIDVDIKGEWYHKLPVFVD